MIRSKLTQTTTLASLTLCSFLCAHSEAPSPAVNSEVMGAVAKEHDTIEAIAQTLWAKSEVSLFEYESAKYLKDLLVENGFEITDEGSAGVPTAFVAEYGSGEPILGVMLEYDALQGMGNEPVPYRQEREDGVTAGHGCGHNLIGAGSMGAALALKNMLESTSTSGTLRVYGGAAEETEGAKVYMARDGYFDDLTAMLHWHPSEFTGVANIRSAAQQQVYVEFHGKTAHAGTAPWLGRSALDAVELFLNGVNYMREHVRPTARIHYVIRNGGESPNIVPDKASLQLTFRDESRQLVADGVAWLEDIAKGAGLMTQTEPLFAPYFGMYDLLPNTPLAERMQVYVEAVGVPEFTDEEQAFARKLQASVNVEPNGLADSVAPLPNEPTLGGSTDVGDISWIVPTMGVSFSTLPKGIGLHTWMAASSHGTSIGTKGAINAAEVLALLGWDIFTDPELREAMDADFEQRTEGFTYVSPLPDLIKEPVGLPEDVRKFGSIGELKQAVLNSQGDHSLVPNQTDLHDHGHDHIHGEGHEH